MSANTIPGRHPQPSPEAIADILLGFARREFWIRTYPNDSHIWSTRLRLPKLGKTVFVEVTSRLALRVRDRETGEVLAQSKPFDFDTLDMTAPSIEEMFLAWQESRETAPVKPAPELPKGGEA